MNRAVAAHITAILSDIGATPEDYAMAAGAGAGLVRCMGMDAAATYTGLSPRTIRRLYDERQLAGVRIGSRVVFDRADLDQLIEQSKGG